MCQSRTRGDGVYREFRLHATFERSGRRPGSSQKFLRGSGVPYTRVKAIHADLPVADMFATLRGRSRLQGRMVANVR